MKLGLSAADKAPATTDKDKPAAKPATPRFEISFPREMSTAPLDGHVLLLISNNDEHEPRFQVSFMTAQGTRGR